MRHRSIHLALGSIALLVLAGCDDGERGEPEAPESVRTAGTGLQRAESCDDLLASIQADAIAKIEAMALEWQTTGGVESNDGGMGIGGGVVGQPRDDSPVAEESSGVDGNQAPTLGSDDDGGSTAGGDASSDEGAGPSGHSETNQQVSGVDEADIVKTDGEHLYVLHGTTLQILDSWPAADTSITGEVTIEGAPFEMFVKGGKALIYSSVADPAQAQGEPSYQYCDAFGCYADYYYYNSAFTKLTLVDVASTTPSIEAESYVEGYYVSARLHDSLARGVVQGGFKAPTLYYPEIETTDAWGEPYSEGVIQDQLDSWVARTTEAIAATELADWLPRQYQRNGEALEVIEPMCGDFYMPTPGAAAYGITSIVATDLAAAVPAFSSTVVLGEASTVYANETSLILAQPQYAWSEATGESETTAIHLFAIDPNTTAYVSSGHAPGTIVDQFSIDERGGVVRATTTEWDSTTGLRTSRVVTLEGSGNELLLLDQTEALAPGETIKSTRFLGDRAYVVTFLERDPLFVVDLADPADLKVLGQLKVDGYSDYIHPLEDGHLLTIGRNVDPETGIDMGLMLQIFDVTDPASPTQKHSFTYTTSGWSEANSNHKAFTFYAEQGLLAFPYVDYNAWPTSSSLEVFKVSVASGLEQIGSVNHGALLDGLCDASSDNGYYSCVYTPEVRRGVFIDEFVYSISYGGVMVHGLDDLSTAVATVAFPQPTYINSYGYAVDGGGAQPGVVGDVGSDAPRPEGGTSTGGAPGVTDPGAGAASGTGAVSGAGAADAAPDSSGAAGAGGAAG